MFVHDTTKDVRSRGSGAPSGTSRPRRLRTLMVRSETVAQTNPSCNRNRPLAVSRTPIVCECCIDGSTSSTLARPLFLGRGRLLREADSAQGRGWRKGGLLLSLGLDFRKLGDGTIAPDRRSLLYRYGRVYTWAEKQSGLQEQRKPAAKPRHAGSAGSGLVSPGLERLAGR